MLKLKSKKYIIIRFFLENLKINSSVLDKKCSIKLVRIAKYNFHADAISNQV
jgi:hypothetical protein